MKIKGAIFDMDGTLVDSLMFWDYLWRELGRMFLDTNDFKPSEEVDRNVRTMIFTSAMSYVKKQYGIKASEDELVRFATSKLADFYRYDVKVKRGVIEFLNYLKHQSVKMCIASATDMEYLRIAIESCGLSEYFEFVLSCADIGKGKDQPDIYLMAQNTMGYRAEDICVFEDSYVALETAKAAGFKTVGIYDKYNFGQERLRDASMIYLSESNSMDELIKEINN